MTKELRGVTVRRSLFRYEKLVPDAYSFQMWFLPFVR